MSLNSDSLEKQITLTRYSNKTNNLARQVGISEYKINYLKSYDENMNLLCRVYIDSCRKTDDIAVIKYLTKIKKNADKFCSNGFS